MAKPDATSIEHRLTRLEIGLMLQLLMSGHALLHQLFSAIP